MDPQTVFKAYDVRGRADTGELDEELYRRVECTGEKTRIAQNSLGNG